MSGKRKGRPIKIRSKGVKRRQILKSIPAGAVLAVTACGKNNQNVPNVLFNHGVASGDPLQDRVILWTRVSPISLAGAIEVTCEVSKVSDFSEIDRSETVITGDYRDYTVKLDMTGLEAGQNYYYRFSVGKTFSPTGVTKTLHAGGNENVNFAVVSCSNYPNGYFNAYRAIVDSGPYDAVLHLGDYIYEYGFNGSEEVRRLDRVVDPLHETVTLDDYRRRYALYKTDPDLQEIHRKYPFICIWDDHEFANNASFSDAQNHDETEGDWATRREAAIQAYIEWLPIRVQEPNLTYRSFEFGDLATLAMLDTRIIGRDPQLLHNKDLKPLTKIVIDSEDNEHIVPRVWDTNKNPAQEIEDPKILLTLTENDLPEGFVKKPDYLGFQNRLRNEDRSMLGDQQENWLSETLKRSKSKGVPWQIIGQQIIMSYKPEPDFSGVFSAEEIKQLSGGDRRAHAFAIHDVGYFKPDAWDGYQIARNRVLDLFKEHSNNSIVLTADTHCAWAMALTDKLGGDHVGAEFATHSVTSTSRGDRFGRADEIAKKYLDLNDHMAYSKLTGRGFMTITITPEHTTSCWYFVSTIKSRMFDVELDKALRVNIGDVDDNKIEFIDVTEQIKQKI